jgi:hypothetical protein
MIHLLYSLLVDLDEFLLVRMVVIRPIGGDRVRVRHRYRILFSEKGCRFLEERFGRRVRY